MYNHLTPILFEMNNRSERTDTGSQRNFVAGKPLAPFTTKTITDKKFSDPASSQGPVDRYPIPSFFEYRSKPRNFDFL